MTTFLYYRTASSRLLRLGVSLGAIGALSACSSGSGGTDASPDRTYNIPDGDVRAFADTDNDGDGDVDAGGFIQNGGTIVARSAANNAVTLQYGDGGGATSVAGAQNIRLRRNDAGELTLLVNGVATDFSTSDRQPCRVVGDCGYEISNDEDDIHVSLYNYSGDVDELLTSGRGYAEVVQYQTNQVVPGDGGLNLAGFAAVGTETRDDALAALPTATYVGSAGLNAYPVDGFINNQTSRVNIRGTLTATADFGAGTVTGDIDDLRYFANGQDDYEDMVGSITMRRAHFDENGFEGGLSASSDFGGSTAETALVNATSYSGVFYGPRADEIAGSMSGTGGGMTATGYFEGYQRE